MLKKIVFSLVLLVVNLPVFAQLYKNDLENFNRLRMDGEFIPSLNLIKKIEKDAAKNHPEELPKVYTNFTKYWISAKDYKKAERIANLAFEKSKGKKALAQAYGNYARAYYFYQLNLPDISIDYAKKAEKLLTNNKEIDDDFYAQLNYLFYSIHSQWNDFKLSDFYAEKTIFYSEKARNYNLLITGLSAKATAMGFGFEKTKNTKYKDSVRFYLRKTLPVYRNFLSKIPQNTIAIANINLANDFYLDLKSTGNKSLKDSIAKYLKNIESLNRLYDHNNELKANVLGIKSEIAMQEGKSAEAEKHLLQAYELLKEKKKNPAYYTLYNIATALEQLYKKQGDYPKAATFADERLEYFKKDFDESAANATRSLEAKYENEKIKSELALIQKNNRLQKILKYLWFAITLLILSTLYYTTRNFRNRIKLQAEKAENLEIEKKQTETLLKLENETKARLLAEQKILRLEHEKVQKESIINALKLEQKDEALKEIKTHIAIDSPQRLRTTLKVEERIEDALENSKMEVDGVEPRFFEKLKEKTNGKLTALDMRYCAYFFLGLNSKEIATAFHVEPKSIRMTKYRLKQKLGLEKDQSLETFLKRL